MARIIWRVEECAYPFDFVLAEHLEHGYVFSTPELFLMARPVKHDATYEEITNPASNMAGVADAWLVYAAAGNIWGFLRDTFPAFDRYPFIGFERDNKLRFYQREQLLRHAGSLPENARQVHAARLE